MTGTFSATCEPDRDLIRYFLSGFFELSGFADLNTARLEAHRHLRCAPNQHVTLCDVTGLKIQSQEVVQAFAKVIGQPSTIARRLAFVTGDSLVRMQLRRLREPDPQRIAIFETTAQAEAWLLAADQTTLAA